jgi:hypothetical protein
VGTDEIWDKATLALREALDRHGMEYSVKEGDAAFYGPKIDIDVRDAIGRKWQLSTIQCDFNLPERFGLEYIGADNGRHRPIMLHRALFGSVERFFGVLLEHYGGAFPTWLAPVQVRVLAVTSQHEAYAQSLVKRMRAEGFRVDGVEADELLGGSVKAAGDVNGDQIDDIIIGASGSTANGIKGAGKTYIIFGSNQGFPASLNSSDLNGEKGFFLNGTAENELSGVAVSSAGDINKDSVNDILIGAPGSLFDNTEGKTYVVFGSSSFGNQPQV